MTSPAKPRRKSGPSGPTQPEHLRKARLVGVRLRPEVERQLREIAEVWKCPMGEVIASALVALRKSLGEIERRGTKT